MGGTGGAAVKRYLAAAFRDEPDHKAKKRGYRRLPARQRATVNQAAKRAWLEVLELRRRARELATARGAR
jgi:hypothetical protein